VKIEKVVVRPEVIEIEFRDEKIEIGAEGYHAEEILEDADSIGYCHGRIVKAWDRYTCYEPKFTGLETYIDSDESFETAYLACWTREDCPFRKKCYMNSEFGYV
jgi:hypothetical protein